jgi:hypothetical protein
MASSRINRRQQDHRCACEDRPPKLNQVVDPNRLTSGLLRNNQAARACQGPKPHIGAPAVQEQEPCQTRKLRQGALIHWAIDDKPSFGAGGVAARHGASYSAMR